MKLDGIAAFVAVAEAGSITAAARRLRLSKSVVSERLAELERSLDARLVRRTTRKLSLTEDGAAFQERAARILREVEDAAADLAERRGRLAGPLRLSAPVTFGRLHLGPAVYSFLLRHPQIELTLDLDDRRVDAAAEGYDAVLRHGSIEDSRLVAWRLALSRRVLVASPDYLARRGIPRSLGELGAHDGIFYAIAASPTGASSMPTAPCWSAPSRGSTSTTATCCAMPPWRGWASRCCRSSWREPRSGRVRSTSSISALGRRRSSCSWRIPKAAGPPPS
jgi:DNA-binding transcriptional LysR family regulator